MRRDKSRLQDWRSSACATLTHSVIIRCVARWSADTMPPCLNWVQAWAVALGMTDVATNSQFTAYDAGELYIR